MCFFLPVQMPRQGILYAAKCSYVAYAIRKAGVPSCIGTIPTSLFKVMEGRWLQLLV